MNVFKPLVGMLCVLASILWPTFTSAQPQSAPVLRQLDLLSATGAMVGVQLTSDRVVTNLKGNQETRQVSAIFEPTKGVLWLGVSEETDQFVCSGGRIVRIPNHAGSILRIAPSGRIVTNTPNSMPVLARMLEQEAANYNETLNWSEYRINLITLLGATTLWSTNSQSKGDGMVSEAETDISAGAIPQVMVSDVKFKEAKLAIKLTGQGGLISNLEFREDMVPTSLTIDGIKVPEIPTNSVFLLDRSGLNRVF